MATVNGNDILLFLGSTDATPVYTPVLCLTNNTWGRSRSTTTTNTKCGTYKSNGSIDYSCTATGLIVISPDSDETGHAALVDIFTTDASRKWKIAKALPATGDEIITFEGVINSLNDTFPTEGNATFDLTINPDPTTVSETVQA
jgi:predicted secreted protein